MSRYDAIIVGSGPSALAAAVTLAERRASVMLLTTDPAPAGGSLVQGCFELEPGPWHWTLPALGYRDKFCWSQLLPGDPIAAEELKTDADRAQLTELLTAAGSQGTPTFWSLAEKNLDWLCEWYAQGAALTAAGAPKPQPDVLHSAAYPLEKICAALKLAPDTPARLSEFTPRLGVSEQSFGTWSARLVQYLNTGYQRPQTGWYSFYLRLLERFEELGGQVRLGCPIKGILWRNSRIAGISAPWGDDRSPALIWAENDESLLWSLLEQSSAEAAKLFKPQIGLCQARGGWQRHTLRLGLLPGSPQLPPVRCWQCEDGLLQAQSLISESGTLLTVSRLAPASGAQQYDETAVLDEYTELSGFDPRLCIEELAVDSCPWPRDGSWALPGDDALARALSLPQEAMVRGLYLAGPGQALTCDPDGLLACGRFAAQKVRS